MASANRNHLPNVDDPWEGEAIYAIRSQGLNDLGNPIYSWRDAVKVADADTGRNALNLAATENFEWKMVGRSDDGMVYALAWSNKTGLPQDGGAWMGGNVLFGFLPPNGSSPPHWVSQSGASSCPSNQLEWFRFLAAPAVCLLGLIRIGERLDITLRRVSLSAV